MNYYGGTCLDAREGEIHVLCEGHGTTESLSYAEFQGKTWVIYGDVTHAGRKMLHFIQYDGNGNIVDEFDLNKEFWDCEEDEPGTVYTYRGEEISKEEYYELMNQISKP